MEFMRVISRAFGVKENMICPQCGRRPIRIKRRNRDRLLSMFVPVIRCRCCGRSFLIFADRENQHGMGVYQKN